jgi:ubiquinone/menaquinone biosynthesis C-methylase UbiE
MVVPEPAVRVYERTHAAGLVDDVIRPGGLALTDLMIERAGLTPGALVLDIGCGPGASIEHLRDNWGLEVIGIDHSAALLDTARANTAAPLIRGNGSRLPFVDASVDAVLAECSLSLMPDIDAALAEIRRVLRPGGHLLCSDIYARNAEGAAALRALPFESCIRGALGRDDIAARMIRNGLDLASWEDHSEELRSFAAQLVWRGGSMRSFWCRTGGSGDPDAVEAAVTAARPGYCTMVARRPSNLIEEGDR